LLGVYDYTVVLTYMSLVSAVLGIFMSLNGANNPYLGCLFLVVCGVLDSFDGKVARTKKDRSDEEKGFGIQIDSLSDLVAFGVLPACIGKAFLQTSLDGNGRFIFTNSDAASKVFTIIAYIILTTYVLAALIRLAYFNVSEEIRQKKETCGRKCYEGLPVTCSSVIFPLVLIISHFAHNEVILPYLIVMFLTAFAFLCKKLRVPKPHLSDLKARFAKRG